jgi:putative transposase
VKRSETITASYAGEVECLKQGISPSDIILVFKPIKNRKERCLMANSLSHTKWMCKYHIVFIPKYRRKVIYHKLRADIQGYIRDLCKWKGVEIIEGHMMPDHIHLLLSIPPKQSISSFMGYLKGKSSMMIFKDHANLRYKFGNSNFWATGYYVSTVGLNEATIRKYIREQEKEDVLEDKLTKREFNNPFKGLLK